VSRINDAIEEIERRLDRDPGITPDDLLSRRLILREVLTAWGTERYAEGVSDGRRDVWDAQRAAERLAAKAGEENDSHG
jgi:hypothetical protein